MQVFELVRAAGLIHELREDTHFFCTPQEFTRWAGARRTLRLEYFYRWVRQRERLLLDGDGPCGGRWNFDAENRASFGNRGPGLVPPSVSFAPDRITTDVLALVERFDGWVWMLGSGVASAIMGVALLGVGIGAVVFRLRRLRGELFALLTLAVTFVIATIILNTPIDGGGGIFMSAVPLPAIMGSQTGTIYVLGFAMCVLTLAIAWWEAGPARGLHQAPAWSTEGCGSDGCNAGP